LLPLQPVDRRSVARLDTRRGIETPEGVKLAHRPAGPVPRFAAFAIDLGIRWLALMIVMQVMVLAGNTGFGVIFIAMFLLEWFYPVVFELSLAGATPGKRVMGIAVVMDNGLPVNAAASITRNLLRAADFFPMLYGFGLIAMLSNASFKRLGDMAAGTLVVYRERNLKTRQLPEAEPVSVQAPLSPELQLALMGLAERSPKLTPERFDELVALVSKSPLGGEAGLAAQRNRVFGMAQWLAGKR
jgi:uncharacterized RDD family membrane protein YckC